MLSPLDYAPSPVEKRRPDSLPVKVVKFLRRLPLGGWIILLLVASFILNMLAIAIVAVVRSLS